MKTFTCKCGERLFFENTKCLSCGSLLAYEFETDQLHTLEKSVNEVYPLSGGRSVRLCQNYLDYDVCNACIDVQQETSWCIACQLNETIPNLDYAQNLEKWAKLESAKRRLVRTLLKLNLSVIPKTHQSQDGLAFAFLEDQSQNPDVFEVNVMTGHHNGLITINLAETDDWIRESTRLEMGEFYRTLLGHLRHESGHYYFERYVLGSENLSEFERLFGDYRQDYEKSLKNYYATKPTSYDHESFISAYSQAHPLEDWAECWAHYFHIVDTLETAYAFGILKDHSTNDLFSKQLSDWTLLTVKLNELNRSMGLGDIYPFILGAKVINKLKFVHQVIDPMLHPKQ